MPSHRWSTDTRWTKELQTEGWWFAYQGRREWLLMHNGGDYGAAEEQTREHFKYWLAVLQTEFPRSGSKRYLLPTDSFKGEATTHFQAIEWAVGHVAVAVSTKDCPNGECWEILKIARNDDGKYLKMLENLLPRRSDKPEGAASGDADDDMTMDRLLAEMSE